MKLKDMGIIFRSIAAAWTEYDDMATDLTEFDKGVQWATQYCGKELNRLLDKANVEQLEEDNDDS